MKNPLEIEIWQTIQIYRKHVLEFTEEQKKGLNTYLDAAEQVHTNIFKLGSVYKNLRLFERDFEKFGGDMEQLSNEVNEILRHVDPRLKKAGEIIGNSPEKLAKLSKMKFVRK